MLLDLRVENFALIDNLELNMKKGFNILTGETGAGKSILIDAIGFVLGDKFNRDLIRSGKEKMTVEAIFKAEDKANELIESLGIDTEEIIIIRREGFIGGRTSARVNGKTVLIGTLKKLGKDLLDIHGQHNSQNLLDSAEHMGYLDSFIGLKDKNVYKDYKEEYEKLLILNNKLKSLTLNGDNTKVMDYLKFQIDDIIKANLKVEEEKEAEERFKILSNAEKISKNLNDAYSILNEEESVIESLAHAIKDLKDVEKFFEKLEGPIAEMESAFFVLEEAARTLYNYKDSVYFDEQELNDLNERLFTYSSMKRKYGTETKDVLEYLQKIEKEYDELINSKEIILKLEKDIKNSKERLFSLGEEISKIREKGSLLLNKNINSELKFIGLEKADFKVNVEKTKEVSETGINRVNFLISTNLGEPKKPLEKIVSGGELSRIMLALKVSFMNKDKTPSVIFDEIDTGISGRVAEAVGEKMYSLSKSFQVFCVTHLPQIAAFSDNHLLITKKEKDKRTFTNVKMLDKKGKIEEISNMIGGSYISKVTEKNAEDILNMTEKIKNKYNTSIKG